MKLFFKNKELSAKEEGLAVIRENLEATTKELQMAYTNMQNVVEPDLIDYYIYQSQAAQIRYEHLLSCAKKLQQS